MNIYDIHISEEDVCKRRDDEIRNLERMVRELEAANKATQGSKLVFS